MKRFKTFASLFILSLTLASCTNSSDEAGNFMLLSIVPTQASPGESIVLSGLNFVPGMQVCFGDGMNMCTGVLVTSLNTGTAIVPAGSGSNLPVRVILSNGLSQNTSVLFSYGNSSNGNSSVNGSSNGNSSVNGSSNSPSWKQDDHEVISDAPKIDRMTPTGGKVGTSVTIYGANLNKANQVCFGDSCVNVTPSSDKIVVNAPAGSGNVQVRVTGPDWTIKAGSFSYIEYNTQSDNVDPVQNVEWCRLNYVPATAQLGEMTTSYAEVFKDGCTPDSSSRCSNMKGQIGYVADNSATKNDPATWTWIDARQNTLFSHDNGNLNDEYMGELSTLGEGTYRIAFRYSMDGMNWLYCDYDSSSNGFSAEQAGTMTVSSQKPLSIEWCRIVNGNTNISSNVNEESEAVYAQFFVSNDCTKDRAQCPNLRAQIGYGYFNLFSTDELNNNFTWKDAVFNSMYDGSGGKDHNEYMGTVSTSSEGNYAVLFRGSVDGGNTWTYCDTSDNNSFSANDAVSWSVGNGNNNNGNNNNGNPLQVTETFGDFYFHLIPERDYECVLPMYFKAIESNKTYTRSFRIDSNAEIDKVQYCSDMDATALPHLYDHPTVGGFFEVLPESGGGKCEMLWSRDQARYLYTTCGLSGSRNECMIDDNHNCYNGNITYDCGHGNHVEFTHYNFYFRHYHYFYTYIFTLTDGTSGYCYYKDTNGTYRPGTVAGEEYVEDNS